MLVNNFSVGIIGGILSIVCMFLIGPVCTTLTGWLGNGVEWLVSHRLLPITAVLVEPAKVLFLNNAINHGVFTPIGAQEAMEAGKSILFMIESNPGPGLGLLLAYCVAGKGSARSSAAGAAFIQFVGGIHELYFPYVLMNPILILAPMAGNAAGILVLSLLGGGLKGAASPGSIIAEMLMTPKDAYLANILGIAVAAAVSFALAVVLLKAFGKEGDLEAARQQVAASKAASKGQAVPVSTGAAVRAGEVRKIVFACDAGMGSSAMGATMLRNKLKDAGITGIEVIHHPVSEIPGDCQIVVTHHELSGRAAQRAPQARIVPIQNFMGAPEYDALVAELLQAQKGSTAPATEAAEEAPAPAADGRPILLEKKNILLGCASVTPEEAIRKCGELMVRSGYVDEAYIQGMLDREKSFSVAIGSHVAIPHGTNDVKPLIKRTGVVVMTYPEGIDWNGDKVKLVVGIAAKGEEHLEVLGRIVAIASTDEDTDAVVAAADVENLYRKLNGLE
jgi:PTS system mannitol-specific IIC component